MSLYIVSFDLRVCSIRWRFFAYALNDVREGLTFERGCRAGEVDDQWVHVNKKKKRPVERSAKHLLKCYGSFF